MTWVDIIICLILARSLYIGFRKGVFCEFFKLAGVVLGVLLGFVYAQFFGSQLAFLFNLPQGFVIIIIFIIIWGITIISFAFIRILILSVIKIDNIGIIGHFSGLLLGLIRGIVISSMMILIMSTIPLQNIQKLVQEDTYFASQLFSVCPRFCERIVESFPWVK